ncbi:TetR/AcrR family transcriptional regulator [Microbacterium lacus]|uniref:TetR/AcrR family transcriptional regulator n=1 Tax=Microbacterium lacus TaxID=415217 RepID=UPI00384BAA4C
MPRRPGPRGSYAKTPKRREEILDAAFGVFARYGYLNSSMSEIAKRAGMTMPGVTHHFPTKAGLLEAVLRERDLDAASHLEGRRGVELLRGVLEIAERDEQDRGLTQLFAILSAEATIDDHPAHAYFRDRYELILRTVRTAFLEAQEDGHLRPDVDPGDAAQMCIALSDGLQLQRLYGVDRARQWALTKRLLDSLLIRPVTSSD